MPNSELPEWLRHTIFIGREGEDDEGEGEGDGEGNDSEDDGEEGSEGEGGEGGSDSDGENIEGLKSALEKERAKNRRLERENLRNKKKREKVKTEQTEEEKANLEETQTKLQQSDTKVARLAEKLRNRERDAAIVKAAQDLGFIDPTDALTDEIRSLVEVDQDDEDPSDIEVDEASAADAVKKLANRKKHLVGKPNEGKPSGGRFKKNSETESKGYNPEDYPALG